eukprot:scaffold7353_cov143-Isochrysis_galbana.AAC.5
MAAAVNRQDLPPARVLDELLPLMAKTRAQQEETESPRRDAVDGDDGLEAEYVLCKFDVAGVEHINFHGQILVQARHWPRSPQVKRISTPTSFWPSVPHSQDLDTSSPRVTLDGQLFSSAQSDNVRAQCRLARTVLWHAQARRLKSRAMCHPVPPHTGRHCVIGRIRPGI